MLVVIPARGGSKGIPRKNIKKLGGKPLIQYSIEAAREIFEDEKIIVSTEDEEIKELVENLGLKVPFVRPTSLATDNSGTREVLMDVVNRMEAHGKYFDSLVLLQPTSPFRTAEHIQEALNLYNDSMDMLVSVKETKANPYYVLREENEDGFLEVSKAGNFTRRQDCPPVWEINGAIYVINIESLKSKPINQFSKVKKYVMDEFSSHDLDTHLDWELAELLVKKQ